MSPLGIVVHLCGAFIYAVAAVSVIHCLSRGCLTPRNGWTLAFAACVGLVAMEFAR